MGSGLGRAWQRLTYWRRATVLLLAAVGWLVAVFVGHARGWWGPMALPLAFLPLVAVTSVMGMHARARRATRRGGPPVAVPPLSAPSPWVALPLVAVLAVVVSRVAAGLVTGGAVDALGVFFAGVVWLVLVQLQHWAGARRPWNLPPLLFGVAAAVSLGLAALLGLVPDQDNLAMMGALLGSMTAWFLVWLARWLPRRRAPGPHSPHPAIGGTLEA